ncbi:MAG: NAD(P)H-hydrate dehydratase [Lachnospiraceae bacterium]|nr:NAD(P)H-hydrate dehydratase [Lachnospiraceae bacterium]
MLHVVSANEMRAMDAHTINNLKVPSAVLMERAALGLAGEVIAAGKEHPGRILIVCGSGNNGGDGAALARILFIKGYRPELLLLGKEERFSPDMAAQMESCRLLGIPETREADMGAYAVIVDAIFGTGLCREVGGSAREAIEAINASGAYVISADIPSGISADSGQVFGLAVRADVTVTMECAKIGQLLYPGALYTGRLVISEIGIYDDEKLRDVFPMSVFSLTDGDLKNLLPPRDPAGNKGSFGKVLVIAGSRGMCGAALFAAEAALRGGCGMVKVLTEEANRVIVQTALPEALFASYGDPEEALREAEKGLAWADVTVIGPGLGQAESARRLLSFVLENAEQPLVIDADGLNILAELKRAEPACLGGRRSKSPVFLTPHMGEMARLSGKSIPDLKKDPLGEAFHFAREEGVGLLMKDAKTVIAGPDTRVWINTSGNSGMAAAGSGDVLAGLLGSLLAQGTEPGHAGALAAFLHGKAGDIAAERMGEAGMGARDILRCLPEALRGESTIRI